VSTEFSQHVDRLWDSGASQYFTTLRRLKLFANKISYSLQIVEGEVNFQDFITLELIRDIYPPLYESIYVHGEYFYDYGMSAIFETWPKRLDFLDDKKALEARTTFYEELKQQVPLDRRYVFLLLATLFPLYADAQDGITRQKQSAEEAEKQQRIFHPRFFRQYFLFRVPAELFSQREFNKFLSEIKKASEEDTKKQFEDVFLRLSKEDFKRWHFMHQIDMKFSEFQLETARGLCRGMAKVASFWTADAFELFIATRCTRKTLESIRNSHEVQSFLRTIFLESSSELYTLMLLGWEEKDISEQLRSDLASMKAFITEQLRLRFITPEDPPSIFDKFPITNLAMQLDPIQFLFGWKRLGTEAEKDQPNYLLTLFDKKPETIDKFLKMTFRAPYVDDYPALKALIDADKLAELIDKNQPVLDAELVRKFRERHAQEKRNEQ